MAKGGRGAFEQRGRTDDPLLADLMPWSAPGVRPGRGWVRGPDPEALRRRWQSLVEAGPAGRERLLCPTRARTVHSAVPQLPGQRRAMVRLTREDGPCPEPVPLLHGAFDVQWIIPDHRLLDDARPELWRVADDRQVFAVEQPPPDRTSPDPAAEPAVVCSAVLPDAARPRGAPGRVRPLYRSTGARRPNLAPGLAALLADRTGAPVAPEDVLAYAVVAAAPGGRVPLTADPALWHRAVRAGRRLVWLHTRGARYADPDADRLPGRPRMPGGRRPFVRATVPGEPGPDALGHDPDGEALLIGDGRIAPVPRGAWEYRAGGRPVLPDWYAARRPRPDAAREPLEQAHPGRWGRESVSRLLDLVTVLALLADLEEERRGLRAEVDAGPRIGVPALRAAGVLPVPAAARRPATVLDTPEEGPEGQFALM